MHTPTFTCTHAQGLVIAGIADIARPAEKLSVRQSGALAATGTVTPNWEVTWGGVLVHPSPASFPPPPPPLLPPTRPL